MDKMPALKKNKSGNKNNLQPAKAVAMNFPMSPKQSGKVPPLKFQGGFSTHTKPATQTDRPTPTKNIDFEVIIKVPGDNKIASPNNDQEKQVLSPNMRTAKSPLGGKPNYQRQFNNDGGPKKKPWQNTTKANDSKAEVERSEREI